MNGKYAPLDIPRWDHKDFKVFHDDILQLVQVIYILYLYECKYKKFYDIYRWDHKDFKIFHDDILQLVQVIYILYLYECKYKKFYDILYDCKI